MDRAEAARRAIDSMKIEGFEFTLEEERDLIELTTAEYYRKLNKKMVENGLKPSKFAIVTCGHTVYRQ